jgi:Leucine-rich repeat (LRR) protein
MKNKTPFFIFLISFYFVSNSIVAQLTGRAPNGEELNKHSGISISFTENKGQIVDQNNLPNKEVKYLLSLPNNNISLKANGFSYDTYSSEKDENGEVAHSFHRIDIQFEGSNPHTQIIADNRSVSFKNYFLNGNQYQVFSYAKLTYKDVYPGIDVEFIASEKNSEKPFEYNFIVHPGAEINDIKLRYSGATGARIEDHKILFTLAHGDLEEIIPASYWQDSQQTVDIRYEALYRSEHEIIVGLTAPPAWANLNESLVVDPTPFLHWGTYYGGNDNESLNDGVADAHGNFYVTGLTNSGEGIATTGSFQNIKTGAVGNYDDAFLAKFNAVGQLVWGTYFGGEKNDQGYSIDIDPFGDIIITGITGSRTGIATPGAYQPNHGGGDLDVLIAKFDSNGNRLWATYFGGELDENGHSIATDYEGNIYVSGPTNSYTGIASGTAHQATRPGGSSDVFLAKFNSAGQKIWSTYYGGTGDESSWKGIAVDASENIFLCGTTTSSSGIATSNAHQQTYGGGMDVFIAKFNSAGSRAWGTYYGGTGLERAVIGCDHYGNPYIAGSSSSSAGIATASSHQPNFIGGPVWWSINGFAEDGMLVKFDTNGNRVWGTYYGGIDTDTFRDLAFDNNDNIILCGITVSPTGIATVGSYSGEYDIFIAKFNLDGIRDWGMYYGGQLDEYASAISLDPDNNIFLAAEGGAGGSSTGVVTAGAHQFKADDTYGDGLIAHFTYNCNPAVAGTIGSDQFVCLNAVPLPLTNVTSGSNGFYQWQLSEDNLVFTDISGATGEILEPEEVTATTYYRRNVIGCNGTVNSNIVTIHVNTSQTTPDIFQVGGSNGVVCTDNLNDPYVSLNGSQSGAVYTLYRNASSYGQPQTGNGSELTWNAIPTGTYTISASKSGCTQLMNGSTSMEVNLNPIGYQFTTVSSGICGDPITGRLENSQTGYSYQLKSSQGGAPVGLPLDGTGSSLEWHNLAGEAAYWVDAIVGQCSTTMNGYVLTFGSSTSIFEVTGENDIHGGIVTLSGGESGVTYTLKKNGVLYTQTIGNNQPISWNSLASGSYTVEAQTSSCKAQMSGTAVIEILPTLSEYNALLALYNATDGPHWRDNTGWRDAVPGVVQDVSGWFGLTIDHVGHVNQLLLSGNNLTGTLPNELGDLIHVGPIFMDQNNLTGPIPASIGNISDLWLLSMRNNKLTSIPSTIGQLDKVIFLYLTDNQITSIPPEIGGMEQLSNFELHNNLLTGSIPSEIGNLSHLSILSLYHNQLTGSIPASIGNATQLQRIYLLDNQLSGPIPNEIGNLTLLTDLNFARNQLSGSIPSSIGNLTKLEWLNLGYNELTGSIPPSIGNLTKLVDLDLGRNKLSGPLPQGIGALTKLKSLEVRENDLSGPIPTGINSINSLFFVSIQSNRFTFSDMLPVKPKLDLWASVQKEIDVEKSFDVNAGATLQLTTNIDRFSSPASMYQWFFREFDGSTHAITQLSTANHTLTLQNITKANQGEYFYIIQNSGFYNFPGARLTSKIQSVYVDCPLPEGGAIGTSQSVCSDTAPETLTSLAAGNGLYLWQSSVDGVNWTDIGFPGADTYSPSQLTVNTSFRRKVTRCNRPAYSNVVTITLLTPLTANAGSDKNVIGLSTTLNSNAPAAHGTGTWSKTSGPGTVSFNDANSNSPTASVSTEGTYVFTWAVTGQGCNSASDDVRVVYNSPAPVADVIYVRKGAAAPGDGNSWGTAYPDLQQALQEARTLSGRKEIWVAYGEYFPSQALDKTISFDLPENTFLYGGFTGVETSRQASDWKKNRTVLTGDLGALFDKTDNSYHIITAKNLAQPSGVEGFIIVRGYANGTASAHDDAGAGLLIVASSVATNLKITNCEFTENEAKQYGGAIAVISEGASVTPEFTNSIFNGNKADIGGAAANIVISGVNTPSFLNCSFSTNRAVNYGGAVANIGSSPTVLNSTFSKNSSNVDGGALYNSNGATTTMMNSICWKNFKGVAEGQYNQIANSASTPVIQHNIIQGGYGSAADDNIDSDPYFVREPSVVGKYPRASIIPVSSTDQKYENQLYFDGPMLWGPWPYYAFMDHEYNKMYLPGRNLQVLDFNNLVNNRPTSTVHGEVYFPVTYRVDKAIHTNSNSIYIPSYYSGLTSINRATGVIVTHDIMAGEPATTDFTLVMDVVVDNNTNKLFCPVFLGSSAQFYGLLELNLNTQEKRWITSSSSPVSFPFSVPIVDHDNYWGGYRLYFDEPENTLYFSTGKGVWWWNRNTDETGVISTDGGLPLSADSPNLPTNKTTGMFMDHEENKFYIGTHEGLYVWDRSNNTSRIYNTGNSKLVHNLINLIDKNEQDHLVYVACEDGGVFVINTSTGEETVYKEDSGSEVYPQLMDTSSGSVYYDNGDKKLYVSADHWSGGVWIRDYADLVPDYGDLSIQDESPAIDRALESVYLAPIATDAIGLTRFVDYPTIFGSNSLDLGAFEKPYHDLTCPQIPPSAGSDLSACNVTATLAADLPFGKGKGQWSMSSGPGEVTFGNINSNATSTTVSQTGTYVFRWTTSNLGCASGFDEVQVVYGPPPASAGDDKVACDFSTALNGSDPDSRTGVWTKISGPGNVTFSNSNATNAIANVSQLGTYVFRWTISAPACITVEDDIQIIFKTSPTAGSISASQNICYGAKPASLKNVAGATGGTYQWEYSGDNLNYFNVDGAVSATYAPPNLTETTYYRRTVVGCSNVPTTPVTITVAQLPVAGEIGTNETICTGSIPSGLVNVTAGENGTYEWQYSGNGSTWTLITNAAQEFYNPPTALTASRFYRRNTVSKVGATVCSKASSNMVFKQVIAKPVAGTITPSASICPGTSFELENQTSGSNVWEYQWEISPTGVAGSWSVVPNATGESYFPPSITATTFFRRNAVSACTVTGPATKITILPLPVAGAISGSQTVCQNAATTAFLSTSPGQNGTYQWQSFINNEWTDIAANAKSATYKSPALSLTTVFRRNTVSACGVASTDPVTITIIPAPYSGTIGSDETICAGIQASDIYELSEGGNGTYQWEKLVGTKWTQIVGSTSASYAPGILSSTQSYRRNVVSASCGTAFGNAVVKTVDQLPLAGKIAGTETVCSGSPTVNMTNVANGQYGSYQWMFSVNNGPWTPVATATLSSYNPQSLTVTTSFMRNVVSANCGTAGSNVVVKTITPLPVAGAIGSNQTICSGSSAGQLTSQADGQNGTYQWQSSPDGTAWTNIAGAKSSTYSPGQPSVTTYYQRNVTGCGTVSSSPVIITVNQRAAGTFNYSGTWCPWNTSVTPPPNPQPTFTGGGVSGIFSSTSGLVFLNTTTGVVDLKNSVPGTYTVTNTIPASGACTQSLATAPLTILSPLAFSVNEVVIGVARTYVVQEAESNVAFRTANSYVWSYIDSKGNKLNVTDPASPWKTKSLGFPAGFLTGGVTNASLIVDITTTATGCKIRRVYGKPVNDGSFRQRVEDEEVLAYEKSGLMLYPNPAQNTLNIMLPFEGETHLELRSMNGILVQRTVTMETTTSMDVSEAAAGIYILFIKNGERRVMEKVEVLR